MELLQPVVPIAAEEAVDREAVGERDLAARSRFCAILQIDVGSGEIGRDLHQAHPDQMALQLGRAIEGAEDAEITSASGGRGAAERQPRAQRQQKTDNAGRGGRRPSHRRGSYPLLARERRAVTVFCGPQSLHNHREGPLVQHT